MHGIQLAGPTTMHPTVTHVPTGAQLPAGPTLTPEQEQAAQDLANELARMGKDVNVEWIKYLMGVLGKSVSAKQAAAIIRCMFNKGYLPNINIGAGSST